MTVMPRAATTPELNKMRSIQQRSALYLTVQPAVTVYTARLAAVPASTDKVVSITYNTGVGTYTNIVQDQTLLVGTTPGGFDLGSVRIRNLSGLGATSGTMNIGQTSSVNWQSNAYLTVLDEFQIWRRDPRVLDDGTGTIFMDWDITYVDQHSKCLSVPVLGPPAVKWLTGASVTVRFDASQSWTVNNTITSYAWVAPGSASSTGMATATPTVTYNATGMYRVACTLTNSDGVSYTGYRYVFVVNNSSVAPMLITQFELDSCVGDYNSGSWSAQVTLAAEADLSTIRDRSLAILHTRDWYGATSLDEGSIGYIDDRENVLLVGWVSLESDLMGMTGRWNTTTFTIQGPGWLLNKPTSYPITLKDKNISPNKWTRFQGVTARALMWHIFMWRTTCMRFMDVFPMDNSWRAARLDAAGGLSLWSQVNTVLGNHYHGSACSDRYGRVHLQRQQNTLDAATRSSIPTVMTLTRNDWANSITFDRRQIDDVGYVNFSGVSWDGSSPTAWFSLSPGHTPGQFGLTENPERMVLFNDQTSVNTYAAAYRGWRNNPYPRFPFSMPMNNRMLDIASYQYIVNNFIATDTSRGFVDTNHRFIPRTIRLNYNKSALFFTTEVECEAETPIGLSVTGDTPTLPPIIPVTPPPPPPPPPPPVPMPSGNAKEIWFMGNTPGHLVVSGDAFAGGDPHWDSIALPAGVSNLGGLGVAMDGSNVYITGQDAGNVWRLYQLTNVAAVRANHATTPVWSAILSGGDIISAPPSGGSIQVPNSNLFMRMCGNLLVVGQNQAPPSFRRFYGEYNGASWTFIDPANDYVDLMRAVTRSWVVRYGFIAPHSNFVCLMRASDGSSFGTHDGNYGGGGGRWAWRNNASSDVLYAWGYGSTVVGEDSLRIQRATAGGGDTTVFTMAHAAGPAPSELVDIRGAWNGLPVWFVDSIAGQLYIAPDGNTFASAGANAVWTTGQRHIIMNAASAGGGTYVWITSAPNSNEFIRYSYDNFATPMIARTGNYWTSINPGGNLNLIDMWMVYGS